MDSTSTFAFLVICAGFTSFITTTLGVGGGVLLLAIMAQILPPQVIIPVHGLVQLGSNAGRAVLAWRSIDWKIIGAFLPGAVVGAGLGSLVLISLPPRYIYLCIALFTLYLCWGPELPKLALGRAGIAVFGAVTNFLTLFVGATGPLVGAFIRQMHEDRFRTVATFAVAMSLQHALKGTVFQLAGFDLSTWIRLIVSMIASGTVGTWLGLKLLRRFENRHFGRGFRIMLTLLALRLLWQALRPG